MDKIRYIVAPEVFVYLSREFQGLRSNPQFPSDYSLRTRAYQGGSKALQLALSLRSTDASTWLELGLLHSNFDNTSEAQEAFAKARDVCLEVWVTTVLITCWQAKELCRDPNVLHLIHLSRGDDCCKRGDYAETLSSYETALSLSRSVRAIVSLAVTKLLYA